MSILSGYKKVKDRILTSSGYQLLSRWTSSNTVDFDDGKTAQTKVGAINGIIKDKNSLSTVTDDSFAAGAVAVKDAIADVNSKLNSKVSITNGGVSIIKEVAANNQAFVNANFVATMPAGSLNRAGYGFHDEGICGAFLYLEPSDKKLHLLMNDGRAYIVNTTLINT